jgi:hypothetical protein
MAQQIPADHKYRYDQSLYSFHPSLLCTLEIGALLLGKFGGLGAPLAMLVAITELAMASPFYFRTDVLADGKRHDHQNVKDVHRSLLLLGRHQPTQHADKRDSIGSASRLNPHERSSADPDLFGHCA